jgi:RNA polymerase sigma-70 factor (ECF subfamily)
MMESKFSLEERFQHFLNHFTDYIRIHTLKYNLHKHGIDPDDIIQDIKIKLWKLISSEKKVTNYPSYIKKMVNSSVIDQLRKFRRDESIFIYERNKYISENELAYSPEFTRQKNLEEALTKAIDLLRDSRRQVVKLYLLNLNVSEIASYLNWTISKTRNLLYRGLSDLKDILIKMGIEK